MKKWLTVCCALLLLASAANAEEKIWTLVTEGGEVLAMICYEPSPDDLYIAGNNHMYRIDEVEGDRAIARWAGEMDLPDVTWLDEAYPVSARNKTIGLYCTHSDECYEPSDGTYTTLKRGSVYQIANALAKALKEDGIDAQVADVLHHPHDAGAYRRSRQTAVELMRTIAPECLIDIHRDGIPDPVSYQVDIGGVPASKIRLLVGRGNQNAEINKEFALTIKAVADRVYPGLIKDIYMGKGAFNQDLLPRSILFECGTYTLDKERVLTSMPMMADVLNRALYGGIVGSAGRGISDVQAQNEMKGGITQGAPEMQADGNTSGSGNGIGFMIMILLIGVGGIAFLSAGSIRAGKKKLLRNVSEMTGGLIGKPPEEDEDHQHS